MRVALSRPRCHRRPHGRAAWPGGMSSPLEPHRPPGPGLRPGARRGRGRHTAPAAERAEVVLTCLPNSKDVEALMEGPEGILAGLQPGACFSTALPESRRRRAAWRPRLAGRRGRLCRRTRERRDGRRCRRDLTVMVGADPATFARAVPVLQAFGKRIEHMGPVGTGDAMKAVNNALLAVNIQAVGEGAAALVKAGVPAAKAFEVLNASSGRSFVSERLVPERVLTGQWPRTFRLALLDKDVGIARAAAGGPGCRGPDAGPRQRPLHEGPRPTGGGGRLSGGHPPGGTPGRGRDPRIRAQ